MRTVNLGQTDVRVPVVAVGCMRLPELDREAAARFIGTALDSGANFFDHADIYGGGACEELFAQALGDLGVPREQVVLQSKCGIRKGMYDFSKEHILAAVDGILRRLRTDYLDVLLLHRPDALMEPEEVAQAFDRLEREGKVRHFGVSNHHPRQIDLLHRHLSQRLVANQVQLSITHAATIASGLNVNTPFDEAIDRDGYLLDYCRLEGITVQPWSPFQHGFFQGVFVGNEEFPQLNAKLDEVAARHAVSSTTVALAWLLRHPARMQPVIGTMNVDRLRECLQASEVELTRQEWYDIYLAAGHRLP